MTNKPSEFTNAFNEVKNASRLSFAELSKMTGIPKQTLVNWSGGVVSRPREWTDIARFAKAVGLKLDEATDLLQAADYPSVQELLTGPLTKPQQEALQEWVEEAREQRQRQSEAWSNLGPPLGDFQGRQSEIQEIVRIVKGDRKLCIVHGMSGVGKTTMVNQAIHTALPNIPDGVLCYRIGQPESDLEPTFAPTERVLSVLNSLAERFAIDLSRVEGLVDRSLLVLSILTSKRAVLVLDGVTSTDELKLLLPGKGNCATIVTTRDMAIGDLSDGAEYVWVQPFDDERLPVAIEFLRTVIGEDLLRQEIDPEAGVNIIAEYVGGLPIALRIAGNVIRSKKLTIPEYCTDYLAVEERRFDNLDSRVQRVLESAYRVLPDDLKSMFVALSIFGGSDFSVHAVAAAMQYSVGTASKNLRELESHSLIELVPQGVGASPYRPTRFSLHNLLALLAADKLTEYFADQENIFRSHIADYFTELCVRYSREGFSELTRDWDNIRSVMEWLLLQQSWTYFIRGLDGLTEPHLGTAGYLDVSGRWSQATRWIDKALDWLVRMESPDRSILPDLWFKRGVFALRQGELTGARNDLLEAERVFGEATSNMDEARLRQAQACHFLSQLEVREGNAKAALDWLNKAARLLEDVPGEATHLEEGYTYIRKGSALGMLRRIPEVRPELEKGLALLPDTPTTARASGLMSLGTFNIMMGNRQQAISAWNGALADAQALGDKRQQLNLLRNLSNAQAEHGEFQPAIQEYLKAIEIYREIGDSEGLGLTLSNLGLAFLESGDQQRARECLDEAKRIGNARDLREVKAQSLTNLARWHISQGELDVAEVLLLEVERVNMSEMLTELERTKAIVEYHRGRYNPALTFAEQSLVAANDVGTPTEIGRTQRVLGEVLSRLGRSEEAKAAYVAATEQFGDNEYEQALTRLSREVHLGLAG